VQASVKALFIVAPMTSFIVSCPSRVWIHEESATQ
jgi:hypothetical protein